MGLSETSAATSIGLIQAAKYGINCAIVQEVEEEEDNNPDEIIIEEPEVVTEVPAEEKNDEVEKVEDNENRDLFGNVVKEEEAKPKPTKKPIQVKKPRAGKEPFWKILDTLFNEVGKEIEDSDV